MGVAHRQGAAGAVGGAPGDAAIVQHLVFPAGQRDIQVPPLPVVPQGKGVIAPVLQVEGQVQAHLPDIPVVEGLGVPKEVPGGKAGVAFGQLIIEDVIAAVLIAQAHHPVAAASVQGKPALLLFGQAGPPQLHRRCVRLIEQVELPQLQHPVRGQVVHLPPPHQLLQFHVQDVGGGHIPAHRPVGDGLGVLHDLLHIVLHAGIPAGAGLFRLRRRVGGAGGDDRHTGGRPQQDGPPLGALPFQHVSYPASGVPLPEGQGRSRQDAPAGGQGQQGGGVVRPHPLPQLFHHRLVAAHLHVPAHQQEGRPHQGVEPVDAQNPVGQQLHQVVQAADVVPLVEEDVPPLPLRQGGGQVDLRPQHPQHKGGGDVVGQIDVSLQGDRPHQAAAQSHQGEGAVSPHPQHPRQPDQGGDGHRGLQGVGHRLFLPLRQGLVYGLAHPGDGQLHLGIGGVDHVPGYIRHHRGRAGGLLNRGVHQVQKGEPRRQGHRARQAEQHHRPQGVGAHLGGPAQQQPGQQDREDDHAGGQTHVQHCGEQFIGQEIRQHDFSTSCSGRSAPVTGQSPPGRASSGW